MIKLEPVNEKYFKAVLSMEVDGSQKEYVADNIYSIAEAWLYYSTTKPFVILNDDKPVGFLMLDWKESERVVGVWRLMIDKNEQNKGYGKQAMEQVIEMIKETDKFDIIALDYVRGNRIAKDLYFKLGFRETGEVIDGEVIMTLPIAHQAKVGYNTANIDNVEELMNIVNINEYNIEKDKMKELIKDNKIIKFTLYGKAIGLRIDNQLIMNPKFNDRLDEINEILGRL